MYHPGGQRQRVPASRPSPARRGCALASLHWGRGVSSRFYSLPPLSSQLRLRCAIVAQVTKDLISWSRPPPPHGRDQVKSPACARLMGPTRPSWSRAREKPVLAAAREASRAQPSARPAPRNAPRATTEEGPHTPPRPRPRTRSRSAPASKCPSRVPRLGPAPSTAPGAPGSLPSIARGEGAPRLDVDSPPPTRRAVPGPAPGLGDPSLEYRGGSRVFVPACVHAVHGHAALQTPPQRDPGATHAPDTRTARAPCVHRNATGPACNIRACQGDATRAHHCQDGGGRGAGERGGLPQPPATPQALIFPAFVSSAPSSAFPVSAAACSRPAGFVPVSTGFQPSRAGPGLGTERAGWGLPPKPSWRGSADTPAPSPGLPGPVETGPVGAGTRVTRSRLRNRSREVPGPASTAPPGANCPGPAGAVGLGPARERPPPSSSRGDSESNEESRPHRAPRARPSPPPGRRARASHPRSVSVAAPRPQSRSPRVPGPGGPAAGDACSFPRVQRPAPLRRGWGGERQESEARPRRRRPHVAGAEGEPQELPPPTRALAPSPGGYLCPHPAGTYLGAAPCPSSSSVPRARAASSPDTAPRVAPSASATATATAKAAMLGWRSRSQAQGRRAAGRERPPARGGADTRAGRGALLLGRVCSLWAARHVRGPTAPCHKRGPGSEHAPEPRRRPFLPRHGLRTARARLSRNRGLRCSPRTHTSTWPRAVPPRGPGPPLSCPAAGLHMGTIRNANLQTFSHPREVPTISRSPHTHTPGQHGPRSLPQGEKSRLEITFSPDLPAPRSRLLLPGPGPGKSERERGHDTPEAAREPHGARRPAFPAAAGSRGRRKAARSSRGTARAARCESPPAAPGSAARGREPGTPCPDPGPPGTAWSRAGDLPRPESVPSGGQSRETAPATGESSQPRHAPCNAKKPPALRRAACGLRGGRRAGRLAGTRISPPTAALRAPGSGRSAEAEKGRGAVRPPGAPRGPTAGARKPPPL